MPPGPEELRAAVDRAVADLDGVTAVFDALLRIAEIEAGSRRAAFADLDLAPLLADLAELYTARGGGRRPDAGTDGAWAAARARATGT